MEIDNSLLICYNFWPLLAKHVLDFTKEYYKSEGVERLHNVVNFNPLDIKDGDIVFVKTDFIVDDSFYFNYFDKIQNKFILITANSSYQIGSVGGNTWKKILESDKLIQWYCTNPPDEDNDKIIPIPIGFEEPSRPSGNQFILNFYLKNKLSFEDKIEEFYLPYHSLDTNSQRRKSYQILENEPFVYCQQERQKLEDYLNTLDKYQFILCLDGRGNDTHRYWETLLVGSVPIMKNIESIRRIFDEYKLPGVFVDSWSEINEDIFIKLSELKYDFSNVEYFLRAKNWKEIIKG